MNLNNRPGSTQPNIFNEGSFLKEIKDLKDELAGIISTIEGFADSFTTTNLEATTAIVNEGSFVEVTSTIVDAEDVKAANYGLLNKPFKIALNEQPVIKFDKNEPIEIVLKYYLDGNYTSTLLSINNDNVIANTNTTDVITSITINSDGDTRYLVLNTPASGTTFAYWVLSGNYEDATTDTAPLGIDLTIPGTNGIKLFGPVSIAQSQDLALKTLTAESGTFEKELQINSVVFNAPVVKEVTIPSGQALELNFTENTFLSLENGLLTVVAKENQLIKVVNNSDKICYKNDVGKLLIEKGTSNKLVVDYFIGAEPTYTEQTDPDPATTKFIKIRPGDCYFASVKNEITDTTQLNAKNLTSDRVEVALKLEALNAEFDDTVTNYLQAKYLATEQYLQTPSILFGQVNPVELEPIIPEDDYYVLEIDTAFDDYSFKIFNEELGIVLSVQMSNANSLNTATGETNPMLLINYSSQNLLDIQSISLFNGKAYIKIGTFGDVYYCSSTIMRPTATKAPIAYKNQYPVDVEDPAFITTEIKTLRGVIIPGDGTRNFRFYVNGEIAAPLVTKTGETSFDELVIGTSLNLYGTLGFNDDIGRMNDVIRIDPNTNLPSWTDTISLNDITTNTLLANDNAEFKKDITIQGTTNLDGRLVSTNLGPNSIAGSTVFNKDIEVQDKVQAASVATTGNTIVGGELEVTGTSTFSDTVTINSNLTSNSISTPSLTATNATINGELTATNATINGELTSNSISTPSLTATNATINSNLTSNSISTPSLTATNATINGELTSNSISTPSLTATQGTINKLQSNEINSYYVTGWSLKATGVATIDGRLTATNATINDELTATNATISEAATIKKIQATSIISSGNIKSQMSLEGNTATISRGIDFGYLGGNSYLRSDMYVCGPMKFWANPIFDKTGPLVTLPTTATLEKTVGGTGRVNASARFDGTLTPGWYRVIVKGAGGGQKGTSPTIVPQAGAKAEYTFWVPYNCSYWAIAGGGGAGSTSTTVALDGGQFDGMRNTPGWMMGFKFKSPQAGATDYPQFAGYFYGSHAIYGGADGPGYTTTSSDGRGGGGAGSAFSCPALDIYVAAGGGHGSLTAGGGVGYGPMESVGMTRNLLGATPGISSALTGNQGSIEIYKLS